MQGAGGSWGGPKTQQPGHVMNGWTGGKKWCTALEPVTWAGDSGESRRRGSVGPCELFKVRIGWLFKPGCVGALGPR